MWVPVPPVPPRWPLALDPDDAPLKHEIKIHMKTAMTPTTIRMKAIGVAPELLLLLWVDEAYELRL